MLFPDAVSHEPAIDAWLLEQSTSLGEMARYWFNTMRACGSDVRELMHDGHPTACVGEAAFCYVNVFTAHVNIGFFLGVALDDPLHLLEGTGKFMRHIKVKPGGTLATEAIQALIEAAYLDMRHRVAQTCP